MIIAAVFCLYFALADTFCLDKININRNFYKEALALEQNKEYRQAYYAYKKVAPIYCAYDAVLYHQALCSSKIEDEKTAIKKLETLVNKYPNSKLAPVAHYKLAQAYLRNNEDAQAKRTFKKIAKKYPDTEYKIASYYYLSVLEKNNLQISNKNRKKYIQICPDGRFALECANGLIASGEPLNEFDNKNVGLVFYYAKNYPKAIEYFIKTEFNNVWYYLAKSYYENNQRDLAKQVIRQGFEQKCFGFSVQELNNATRIYAKTIPAPSYETWCEIEKMTQGSPNYPYVLYNLAGVSPVNQRNELYIKIVKDYPENPIGADVLWKLFWDNYKSQNYHMASVIAKRHEQNYKGTATSAKILFWHGKVLEKEGQKKQAANKYRQLIEDYSANYYAYRAQGRLDFIEHGKDTGFGGARHQKIKSQKMIFPFDKSRMSKKYGKSFVELVEVNDFEIINLYNIDDKLFEAWIEYKKVNISKCCLIAKNLIDMSYPSPKIDNPVYRLAFPVEYEKEINKNATMNHLDANLIISLTREESYFNPNAQSSSGAVGLMQILPSTAAHISSIRGLDYQGKSCLFNPAKNITLGTSYINYLYDLNKNMAYTVASYNAGPGAVQRWKANFDYDIDEFIENIPYPETQNYVKKVYRSYWCYKRLY